MDRMIKWIGKFEKRKLYWLCILIFMVINIPIAIYMNQENKILHVDGQDFKLIEQTPIKMVFESKEKHLILGTKDVTSWSIGMLGKLEINYDQTFVIRKHAYHDDISISYDDGREIIKTYDSVARAYIPVSKELYMLEAIENFQTRQSPSVFVLGPILLNFLGFALIFYPKEFWSIHTMFIVSGGQPTSYAIWSNIVSGLVIVLFINIYFWSFI